MDIDENNSLMWELDVVFDEVLKFKNLRLDLPVMVANPSEMDEDTFNIGRMISLKWEKQQSMLTSKLQQNI